MFWSAWLLHKARVVVLPVGGGLPARG
jgi:hypothetical protein